MLFCLTLYFVNTCICLYPIYTIIIICFIVVSVSIGVIVVSVGVGVVGVVGVEWIDRRWPVDTIINSICYVIVIVVIDIVMAMLVNRTLNIPCVSCDCIVMC